MDDLVPLALSIAPEIARWLSGKGAEGVKTASAAAIQAVTGTSDPEAAGALLRQNPAASAQLRVQLAQLAAAQENAARAVELGTLTAALRDTTTPKPAVAWSAPIISAVVLLTFGSVMLLVLTLGVPAGNETIANMLLGTLAAMATSVVSYWVGSSAGSARKEERLAQTSK